MAATNSYFSSIPCTVILQTSSGFDGTAVTGTPTQGPGEWVFPAQAGGGLYNFHTVYGTPIRIQDISYQGSGTCTVNQIINGTATPIAALSGTAKELFNDLVLSGNTTLSFQSSGAGQVAIVATEVGPSPSL
jgi:hypothetical protein